MGRPAPIVWLDLPRHENARPKRNGPRLPTPLEILSQLIQSGKTVSHIAGDELSRAWCRLETRADGSLAETMIERIPSAS